MLYDGQLGESEAEGSGKWEGKGKQADRPSDTAPSHPLMLGEEHDLAGPVGFPG